MSENTLYKAVASQTKKERQNTVTGNGSLYITGKIGVTSK